MKKTQMIVKTPEGLDVTGARRFYDESQAQFEAMVMDKDFDNGWSLVRYKTEMIDAICGDFYDACMPPGDFLFLATGGYGRGEMTELSDIDMTVVTPRIDDDTKSILISYTQNVRHLFAAMPFFKGVAIVNGYDDFNRFDYTQFSTLMDSRLLRGDQDLFIDMRNRLINEMDGLHFILEKLGELEKNKEKHADAIIDYRQFHIKKGYGGLREFQIGVTFEAIKNYEPLQNCYQNIDKQVLAAVGLLFKIRCWQGLHGKTDMLMYPDITALRNHFGNPILYALICSRKIIHRFVQDRVLALLDTGIQLHDGLYYRREGLGICQSGLTKNSIFDLLATAQQHGLSIEGKTFNEIHKFRLKDPHPAFIALFYTAGSLTKTLSRLWYLDVLDNFVPGFEALETALYEQGHPREGRSKAYQAIRRIYNLEHLLNGDFGRHQKIYEELQYSDRVALKLGLLLLGIPDTLKLDVQAYLADFAHIYPSLSTHIIGVVEFLITHKGYLYSTAQMDELADNAAIKRFVADMNSLQLDILFLFTSADLGYGLQEWFPQEQWDNVFNLYDQAKQELLGDHQHIQTSFYLDDFGNHILQCLPPELLLTRGEPELIYYTKRLQRVQKSKHPVVEIRKKYDMQSRMIEIYAPDRKGLFLSIVQILYEAGISIKQAYVYSVREPYHLALDLLTVSSCDSFSDDEFATLLRESINHAPLEAPKMPKSRSEMGFKVVNEGYRLRVSGMDCDGMLYSMVYLVSQVLNGDIRSIKAYSSRKGTMEEFFFFASPLSFSQIQQIVNDYYEMPLLDDGQDKIS